MKNTTIDLPYTNKLYLIILTPVYVSNNLNKIINLLNLSYKMNRPKPYLNRLVKLKEQQILDISHSRKLQ